MVLCKTNPAYQYQYQYKPFHTYLQWKFNNTRTFETEKILGEQIILGAFFIQKYP